MDGVLLNTVAIFWVSGILIPKCSSRKSYRNRGCFMCSNGMSSHMTNVCCSHGQSAARAFPPLPAEWFRRSPRCSPASVPARRSTCHRRSVFEPWTLVCKSLSSRIHKEPTSLFFMGRTWPNLHFWDQNSRLLFFSRCQS